MRGETEVKEQVRQFYDAVGWKQIGEGLYQNARYEDLRPVSREYLHRCHLRVARYLRPAGVYLLDAGSGPIQYPEYLRYSKGYRYRVCLDISRLALTEARARIGEHGLYVVGDVAHLPFCAEVFEGLVSLHTVHHLPPKEHELAFQDFYRTLKLEGQAVVVYSWGARSSLMRLARPLMELAFALLGLYRRLRRASREVHAAGAGSEIRWAEAKQLLEQPGTYTFKHSYAWVRETLGALPGFEIRVWRAVSTSFLRAFIHHRLLGETWLRVLFWLEERMPQFMGRHGQYAMILFSKPARSSVPRKRGLN